MKLGATDVNLIEFSVKLVDIFTNIPGLNLLLKFQGIIVHRIRQKYASTTRQ